MGSEGIWIDIHVGEDEKNPILTKRYFLVWPHFSCGERTIQEYFLEYEYDLAHNFTIRLSETLKELDLDKYRQAQCKLKKS